MIPNTSIAFDANSFGQGTWAWCKKNFKWAIEWIKSSTFHLPSVRSKTFPPVANPCFAVITYGTHHLHSWNESTQSHLFMVPLVKPTCCVLTRMPYNAVARLHHAFCFCTLCTLRKPVKVKNRFSTIKMSFVINNKVSPLDSATKVTKCSILLLFLTFVTFHESITSQINNTSMLTWIKTAGFYL